MPFAKMNELTAMALTGWRAGSLGNAYGNTKVRNFGFFARGQTCGYVLERARRVAADDDTQLWVFASRRGETTCKLVECHVFSVEPNLAC